MSERQIVLDTETTGLEPSHGHRVIEIGCLELINRRLTGRKFQTYLNPEREVDPGATAVSGLTYNFLQDKPKFLDVVDEFLQFIEDAELIIHNAPFDLGFLNSELKMVNYKNLPLEQHFSVFDTLQLARKLHPGQKNNLDALCKRYKVDNSHRNFHGALLDADILAKVYLQMTAGQAAFSLDSDTNQVAKSAKPARFTKIKKGKNGELVVIKADEEEIALNEAIMSKLNKKKKDVVE